MYELPQPDWMDDESYAIAKEEFDTLAKSIEPAIEYCKGANWDVISKAMDTLHAEFVNKELDMAEKERQVAISDSLSDIFQR